MLVAHKYAPTLPSRSGDSPLSEMPPVGFTHIASSVDTQAQNIMKDFRSTTADQIRQWREQNPRTSSVSDLSNFGLMHQVFGHETITMPWQETMRLLDPETNGPIANGVVRLMAGHREERESRLTAWLDLLIDRGPGSSVWMSVGGRPGEPCYAVILPRDLHTPIPVRLDVTYENTLNGYVLKDLSARIADPSETTTPMPVTWSALWLAQRTEAFSDLASAGRSIGDFVLLENILDDKTSSPVAAAIAAATLLRCGALDYLHDWPRNLANWFEWLPDGPVLWAETLIRRFDAGQLDPSRAQSPFAQGLNRIESEIAIPRLIRESGAHTEARTFFAMLADRGPPLLSQTLNMARQQATLWRQLLEAGILDEKEASKLRQACEFVERAAVYTVSGGTFARFASAEAFTSPEVVLGARRRVQKQREAA